MEFVIPPPPPDDPRRRVRFRETAVEWLRHLPTFERVSRRLLADLLDVAQHHDLRPKRRGNFFDIAGIALLLVLDGEVVVAAPTAKVEFEIVAHLYPGVYFGGDDRWRILNELRISPVEGQGAYVIAAARQEMARWLQASPTLRHSIGGAPLGTASW